MTTLADACTDLTTWLPRAAALITCPDTDGTRNRTAPGSRPPWNSNAANAFLDALEGIRRLEQELRSDVAGRHVQPRPYAHTGRTLASIQRLALAATTDTRDHAVYTLTRHVTVILQLPAIDLEERPLRPDVPCPRCNRKMLRYWQITGTVACLGCQQKASLQIGYVSGQPILRWDDGEITFAPPVEGTTP